MFSNIYFLPPHCNQHEYMRGDPYKKNPNTGVFGRILDKLKLQGYQTSANTAGTGGTMLTGSSDYQVSSRCL